MTHKLHRVFEFLVSQGITMAGNLLYGFLCVRLLPIPEYAKYVLIFSIQGSITVLMDIGITSTIVPLVGERVDDRQLIADFVASLRQIALRLFALLAPLTVVVYPWLVRNRHWGWPTVVAMVIIVLVSVWFTRVGSAYGVVLILRRDRARWYRTQMISSLGTLVLLLVFYALHWFGVFAAILINVSGIIYVAADYFFRSRRLLGVVGVPSREKRSAIVRLALPLSPGSIFYALYGQLGLFLITVFGRTAGVASVGALTRFSQVFGLISRMNPILIEPYFAKLPESRVRSHYAAILAAYVGFGLCVVILARVFPGLFLWVLGPKYANLRHELVLAIATGCLGLISGLMYTVNCSRRFVYYWQSVGNIALTLLVQGAFFWKADLSSVRTALWFSLAPALLSPLVHGTVALYGLKWGGRKVPGIDYRSKQGEVV